MSKSLGLGNLKFGISHRINDKNVLAAVVTKNLIKNTNPTFEFGV